MKSLIRSIIVLAVLVGGILCGLGMAQARDGGAQEPTDAASLPIDPQDSVPVSTKVLPNPTNGQRILGGMVTAGEIDADGGDQINLRYLPNADLLEEAPLKTNPMVAGTKVALFQLTVKSSVSTGQFVVEAYAGDKTAPHRVRITSGIGTGSEMAMPDQLSSTRPDRRALIAIVVITIVVACIVLILFFRRKGDGPWKMLDSVPVSTQFKPTEVEWNETDIKGWVNISKPHAKADDDTVALKFDPPGFVSGTPPQKSDKMKKKDPKGNFKFDVNAPSGGTLKVTGTYNGKSKTGELKIKKKPK